jgi:hypothetical protein
MTFDVINLYECIFIIERVCVHTLGQGHFKTFLPFLLHLTATAVVAASQVHRAHTKLQLVLIIIFLSLFPLFGLV